MAKDDRDETERAVVEDNYLHHGGRVFAAGTGVWIAQSGDNRVAHNEIHDFFYTGISLGWNWGEGPNRSHPNTIEFNHIHHLLDGMLSDGGGVYTLGTHSGTVIRNNLIHDIWPYMGAPAMAWGIYLDAGSSGLLIERNVVYHTLTGGLMNTGGNANTIRSSSIPRTATIVSAPRRRPRRPSGSNRSTHAPADSGEIPPGLPSPSPPSSPRPSSRRPRPRPRRAPVDLTPRACHLSLTQQPAAPEPSP